MRIYTQVPRNSPLVDPKKRCPRFSELRPQPQVKGRACQQMDRKSPPDWKEAGT